MRILFALLATCALAACGGPGRIEGTIVGRTIDVKSSAMVEQATSSGTLRYVVLSDRPDICTVLKANRQPKNANSLFLTLVPLASGTPVPLTVGDYTIGTPPSNGTGKYASASLSTADANCREMVPADHSGPGQRWIFFPDGGECLSSRGFTRRYLGEHICLVELGKPARGGCVGAAPHDRICTVEEWPVQGAACERGYCRVRTADGGLW